MAIYNPGKYYLVSVDEKQNVCCISHFDVENIEQKFKDVYSFNPHIMPQTIVTVTGQLYGQTKILQARDLENISYEEIMELLGVIDNEQNRDSVG